MEKIGVMDQTFTSGSYKDAGSSLRPMAPEEREMIQSVLDDLYRRFQEVVATGRPTLGAERVAELADGRIYSAPQAHAAGLIDGISDLPGAIEEARRRAGLEKARVVSYHRRREWRENLYTRPSAPATPLLDAAALLGVLRTPSFLYLWRPGGHAAGSRLGAVAAVDVLHVAKQADEGRRGVSRDLEFGAELPRVAPVAHDPLGTVPFERWTAPVANLLALQLLHPRGGEAVEGGARVLGARRGHRRCGFCETAGVDAQGDEDGNESGAKGCTGAKLGHGGIQLPPPPVSALPARERRIIPGGVGAFPPGFRLVPCILWLHGSWS
jgi:hypothetical protein